MIEGFSEKVDLLRRKVVSAKEFIHQPYPLPTIHSHGRFAVLNG